MPIVSPTSIYIHVPFCQKICTFCDFKRTIYNPSLTNAWLNQLANEINYYAYEIEAKYLKSIYIGGGTPSCLNEGEWNQLITLIKPWLHQAVEVTMEVNPEDINDFNLDLWKTSGINRLSVGVESFNDCQLNQMNRSNKVMDLNNLMQMIQHHGFTNISFDIMYGLPNQSLEDYQATLQQLIALNPKHISAYCLTVEENSVWGKQGIKEVDDDLAGQMMELTTQLLKDANYHRYEVSNYSLPGYESIHNQTYWHYDNFVGFGYGASGKSNHIRYDHGNSLMQYLANDGFKRCYIHESKQDVFEDFLMMNLRLKQPLSFASINSMCGYDFYQSKYNALQLCQNKGYLTFNNQSLSMNDYGLDCLLDALAILLVEE